MYSRRWARNNRWREVGSGERDEGAWAAEPVEHSC